MTHILILCTLAAVIPSLLFLSNLRLYVAPPSNESADDVHISVLIPARNEARLIERAIRSVLQNRDVDLELLIADDHSTDDTRSIVQRIAETDARVRLIDVPALPSGWSGKQHACWNLALASTKPLLCFIDADVTLAPGALPRMAAFLRVSNVDLASGVPRQITVTWLEQLLLPLIHFVLLSYLPISRMRSSACPAYSAGCGQLFVCRREPYFRAGGHRAIRNSLHDGIKLPAAFRTSNCQTDLFDGTDVASCRMYSTAGEVWKGLAKNATEGMAAPNRIWIFTLLLVLGQIAPFLLLWKAVQFGSQSLIASSALICTMVLLPRVIASRRFRQPIISALLHPIGIAVLVLIQWYAFLMDKAGKASEWKGRSYHPASS